jgi:hypothetical protein
LQALQALQASPSPAPTSTKTKTKTKTNTKTKTQKPTVTVSPTAAARPTFLAPSVLSLLPTVGTTPAPAPSLGTSTTPCCANNKIRLQIVTPQQLFAAGLSDAPNMNGVYVMSQGENVWIKQVS